MASLRETKDRIGSVKSTLKITSAMKLVASSKLRKAQNAIEALRPYETALQNILASVSFDPSERYSTEPTDSWVNAGSVEHRPSDRNNAVSGGNDSANFAADEIRSNKTAIVAIASNSSLCGGFNANAIKKALAVAEESEDAVVYSVGRKMAEAMKKAGFPSPSDLNGLVARPGYTEAGKLAEDICKQYFDGKIGKVVLVYNHFVSTSHQEVVTEQYLPLDQNAISGIEPADRDYYILEPDAETIARELTPKVLRLKLFAAILDSAAAEHAARTVAMQTATDNAQDLLSDLTLEYNKGRQQKITAEILDLMGGQATK